MNARTLLESLLADPPSRAPEQSPERAFQREIARYIDEAEGGNPDWPTFDLQATALCLLQVERVLSKAGDPREKCADARSLINTLICRNAERHARQCLDNGTL